MIEVLVGHGAKHNTGTPVHILLEACAKGDLDQVQQLKIAGGDLGAVDYDKRSGLHLSCAAGHVHVVKYLLEKSVDADGVDAFDRTPLDEAKLHGRTETERLLRKHGAIREDYSTELQMSKATGGGNGAMGTLGVSGGAPHTQSLVKIAASVAALTSKLGARMQHIESHLEQSDARMAACFAKSDERVTAAVTELFERFQQQRANENRRDHMLTMAPSRGAF
jgi:hypothetical protein